MVPTRVVLVVCKISFRPLPILGVLGTLTPDASRYGKARCVLVLIGFRFLRERLKYEKEVQNAREPKYRIQVVVEG